MNITIIGSGYVGLTTGAILSNVGHKVYCVDVDAEKINIIKSGKSYFFEPGLDEIVRKGIESGKLIPTLSYKESIPDSEIAFITVGTPENSDGSVDLRYIFAAAEEIGKYMKNGLIVSTKSTVPVGTGRKVEKILKRTKKKFSLASCPEFLAEGSAVLDTLVLDRIVIGSDSEETQNKIAGLFKTVDDFAKSLDLDGLQKYAGVYRKKISLKNESAFEERVIKMGLESAELVKVTANAFLATKISFANSIARICDLSGAKIQEVMDGVGADKRIGRDFLYAGLGWGGGCFPKDVAGLINFSKASGFDFKMLEQAAAINFDQINYVVDLAKKILNGDIANKKVAVWGLSFKPGTDDIRRSPAIAIIDTLQNQGVNVAAYDPQAISEAKKVLKGSGVEFSNSAEEAVDKADLLILATDWPEFLEIDLKKLKKKFRSANIIDARNRLNRINLEKSGFTYYGIGQ